MYLLDDGKDIEKKKWMHSLNLHNVVYIRCGPMLAHAAIPPILSLVAWPHTLSSRMALCWQQSGHSAEAALACSVIFRAVTVPSSSNASLVCAAAADASARRARSTASQPTSTMP